MKDRNTGHPPRRGDPPGEDKVARRAYEIYQARGGEPGHDLEDWLQAERELNNHGRAVHSD